ncbi:hypothetical protein V3C33_18775 [Micrococcaceae bacterium Sec5.7]
MDAPLHGLTGPRRKTSSRPAGHFARKAAALGLASLLLAGTLPALTFPGVADAAPGDPAAAKAVTPEVPVESGGVPLGAPASASPTTLLT